MAFEKVKEIIKHPPGYSQIIDLASAQLGGKVLYATDDFFAEKENLLKQGRGNTPTGVNGWTVGRAAVNVRRATIGQ